MNGVTNVCKYNGYDFRLRISSNIFLMVDMERAMIEWIKYFFNRPAYHNLEDAMGIILILTVFTALIIFTS